MAGVAEVTKLDESILDDSPPCEIITLDGPDDTCGKPSVARIKVTCTSCRSESPPFFICQLHLDMTGDNALPAFLRPQCFWCRNTNFNWIEV